MTAPRLFADPERQARLAAGWESACEITRQLPALTPERATQLAAYFPRPLKKRPQSKAA